MQRCHEEQSAHSKGARLSPLDEFPSMGVQVLGSPRIFQAVLDGVAPHGVATLKVRKGGFSRFK